MRAEEPSDWAGRTGDGTAGCAQCGDTRWVRVIETDLPGYRFLRPCSTCQPDSWQRWRSGAWAWSDQNYRPLAPPAADGERGGRRRTG